MQELTLEQKQDFESRAKLVQESITKLLEENLISMTFYPAYQATASQGFESIIKIQYTDLKYSQKAPESTTTDITPEV